MPEQLAELDRNLFFAINHGLANPFFDWLMPWLRNPWLWSPLYLFILVFFLYQYKKQGLILLGFFVLTFAITDYLSASIIKPAVARLRPCNDPQIKTGVHSLIHCGSGYSFPSAHAANHFALALFLIRVFYRRWKAVLPLALLWAFLISFAQVYVGVHYPFDVMGGAVIGSIIGCLTSFAVLRTNYFTTWKTGN
ncbi:MAG: phosphatase PAP2 family protein [Daejeonella sp.]